MCMMSNSNKGGGRVDIMEFLFVSKNANKLEEVNEILKRFDIQVKAAQDERKIEIQADKLEEIIAYALSQIKPRKDACLIMEDDGIFIDALNGFPGPYAAQAYATIGLKGILHLLEGAKDRGARFKSAVGILMPDGEKRIFTGVVKGHIAKHIAKGREFGYDPIFIPEGRSKTFAEMNIKEKSKMSHRGIAFSKLGSFLSRARKSRALS